MTTKEMNHSDKYWLIVLVNAGAFNQLEHANLAAKELSFRKPVKEEAIKILEDAITRLRVTRPTRLSDLKIYEDNDVRDNM